MNIYDEIKNAGSTRLDETTMVLWRVEDENTEYTYRELFAGVDAFSEHLALVNMQRGFRVAIVAESCPEWAIAYLAILKLGGTPALVDAMLPQADIAVLIKQSDPACVYASPATLHKVKDDCPLPIFNIHNSGALFPDFEGRVCPAQQDGCDERVASIIFSSGTTRQASGIMHSHDSIIGSTRMCCDNNFVGTGDRFFGVLPNSHIYGLYVQVIAPLIYGGSVCYIASMDAACLVGALQGYKPTVFPAVPRVFDLLRTNIQKKINSDPKTQKLFNKLFPLCLKVRKKTGFNLGRIVFKSVVNGFGGCMKIMASAGAPTSRETAEFYYGCGLNLLITYGATETSIPVVGNYGTHLTTDTCGRPYPDVTIRHSPEGEVLVKSPYLMLGYFRDEQTTKECYDADGWFKTGDLGYVDEHQNVYFTGRVKDNIVLATGKKVAPDDMEAAYAGIPGVMDYAICGVQVALGGHDTVHAFVVTEEADVNKIRMAFQERGRGLSPYMKLHGIHFIDTIPKTTLQKPKRFLLRNMIPSEEATMDKAVKTKPAICEVITAAVSRLAGVPASEISADTRIFKDLPIDSLGAIELVLEVESFTGNEFNEPPNPNITLNEFIESYAVMKASSDVSLKNRFYANIRKKRFGDYGIYSICRGLLVHLYNVKVKNDDLLPQQGGYIICANHVTYFDYLFLTAFFRKERFMTFCCMAKKEFFRKSFINAWVARIAGMIPIDRDGNASISMKAAKEKLMENWGMLIHPEGTRSKTGKMGQFKSGAALLALESGVPIIPAYIKGGFEVYPTGRALPRFINWKTFSRYKIDVIYGEPIFPENQTVDTMMKRLNDAVERIARGEK